MTARALVRIDFEITIDGDGHWKQATLKPPMSPASWVFWHWEWIVPGTGGYTLAVRATDGTGALQASIKAGRGTRRRRPSRN